MLICKYQQPKTIIREPAAYKTLKSAFWSQNEPFIHPIIPCCSLKKIQVHGNNVMARFVCEWFFENVSKDRWGIQSAESSVWSHFISTKVALISACRAFFTSALHSDHQTHWWQAIIPFCQRVPQDIENKSQQLLKIHQL